MSLLSRRSVLAIAAVVDVALHSRSAPVAAKALAARQKLPPRHLETLLQGLVHAKILDGLRGPRGGYELARERGQIRIGEIVRTAMSLSTADPKDLGANSILLERVIDPAVRKGGETFLANLDFDHRRTDVRDGRENQRAPRREDRPAILLFDPGIKQISAGGTGHLGRDRRPPFWTGREGAPPPRQRRSPILSRICGARMATWLWAALRR